MRLNTILLCTLLSLISGCNKTDQTKFIEASTEAEKALDKVLHAASKSGYSLFELDLSKEDSNKETEFTKLFTKEVSKAAFEAEKKSVEEVCGGEYRNDLVCGLNFNPALCSQESNDKYLYRTLKKEENLAIIEYTWPGEENPRGTYKLVKNNDSWLIDGIKCYQIDFNFKDLK
jgi:hypothetical protein